MSGYTVVPATCAHLRELANNLREGDRAEVDASGMKPRHLLHRLWTGSFFARTAIVEGRVAAVWGFGGSLLGDRGEAWLLTTPAVEKVPIAFFKELRANLADMLALKRVVVSHVLSSYSKSIRFMKMAGFSIGEEVKAGPHTFLELRMER